MNAVEKAVRRVLARFWSRRSVEAKPRLEIGTAVCPITPAGLWLAARPSDGSYGQQRDRTCVFAGTGAVLEVRTVTIDYDAWAEHDEIYAGIGRLDIHEYRIRCDAGEGWGSAVEKASTA